MQLSCFEIRTPRSSLRYDNPCPQPYIGSTHQQATARTHARTSGSSLSHWSTRLPCVLSADRLSYNHFAIAHFCGRTFRINSKFPQPLQNPCLDSSRSGEQETHYSLVRPDTTEPGYKLRRFLWRRSAGCPRHPDLSQYHTRIKLRRLASAQLRVR